MFEMLKYRWASWRLRVASRNLVVSFRKEGQVEAARALALLTLGDPSSASRWSGAYSLGLIGDPRDLDQLARCLGADDVMLQTEAAEALGKIGDPRAVEPLETLFRDESQHPAARAAAGRALLRIVRQKQH
jgi:HEAT repeat protein